MKNPFTKKKKLSEDLSLQITSMADIFVILLVFLLKSYASTLTTTSPTGEMSLPEGQTTAQIQESLKLEVSMNGILIDQKPIVSLSNFKFVEKDGTESADNISDPLYKKLDEQRRLKPYPNMDSNLTVLADERMPYSTLKKVLATAAKAGFVDLQLVVVNPE